MARGKPLKALVNILAGSGDFGGGDPPNSRGQFASFLQIDSDLPGRFIGIVISDELPRVKANSNLLGQC